MTAPLKHWEDNDDYLCALVSVLSGRLKELWDDLLCVDFCDASEGTVTLGFWWHYRVGTHPSVLAALFSDSGVTYRSVQHYSRLDTLEPVKALWVEVSTDQVFQVVRQVESLAMERMK